LSQPTNVERAARGEAALAAYMRLPGMDDDEGCAATDLIADVLHYLGGDRSAVSRDRVPGIARRALMHYEEEQGLPLRPLRKPAREHHGLADGFSADVVPE
jgi:hypothetical protein